MHRKQQRQQQEQQQCEQQKHEQQKREQQQKEQQQQRNQQQKQQVVHCSNLLTTNSMLLQPAVPALGALAPTRLYPAGWSTCVGVQRGTLHSVCLLHVTLQHPSVHQLAKDEGLGACLPSNVHFLLCRPQFSSSTMLIKRLSLQVSKHLSLQVSLPVSLPSHCRMLQVLLPHPMASYSPAVTQPRCCAWLTQLPSMRPTTKPNCWRLRQVVISQCLINSELHVMLDPIQVKFFGSPSCCSCCHAMSSRQKV